MSRYEDLRVWQKAMEFVEAVFDSSRLFPQDERFGWTSQLRRSAVSVPSNIAEGQGRTSSPQFKQFLGQARGSLFECETQLRIAKSQRYLSDAELRELLSRSSEIARMLNAMIAKL